MVSFSRILMLAAPLLSSFLFNIVTASPVDYSENLGLLDNALNIKRQAAATCFHAADPENSCPAIANGPGWCECNNNGKTYAIMNTQTPCGWTTLPPTTTFNCLPHTSPVQAPPKLACTLTDQVYGVRVPEVTHICNCNDGSSPKATISAGEYVCPAQVKVVVKKNKRSEYNGIDVSGFR